MIKIVIIIITIIIINNDSDSNNNKNSNNNTKIIISDTLKTRAKIQSLGKNNQRLKAVKYILKKNPSQIC